MSLLENQTFKRKITYVRSDDNDKIVQFVINVQCNHEIDKSILAVIEETISEMLLKDYSNKEDILEQKKVEKETEKLEKLKEKQEQELQKQRDKQRLELEKIREKQEQDFKKQLEEEQVQHQKLIQTKKHIPIVKRRR